MRTLFPETRKKLYLSGRSMKKRHLYLSGHYGHSEERRLRPATGLGQANRRKVWEKSPKSDFNDRSKSSGICTKRLVEFALNLVTLSGLQSQPISLHGRPTDRRFRLGSLSEGNCEDDRPRADAQETAGGQGKAVRAPRSLHPAGFDLCVS